MRSLANLLRRDEGNAVVEFALVCPVVLLVLCTLGDLAFQGYVQDVLTGEVQKAGRDSTVQGAAANTAAIDAVVEKKIRNLTSNKAKFDSSRLSYINYGAINPEPWVDNNSNGKLDKGDCFTDMNNNGSWDKDPGETGQGGAGDVAIYQMTVTYDRLFPIAWFGEVAGLGAKATVSARTILMNQPYANQVSTVKTVCLP